MVIDAHTARTITSIQQQKNKENRIENQIKELNEKIIETASAGVSNLFLKDFEIDPEVVKYFEGLGFKIKVINKKAEYTSGFLKGIMISWLE